MLEIFILIGIARGIGGMAQRKGRAKLGYQFLGVGLWILGEILGFVVGVVIVNATDGADVAPVLIYVSALVGAVIGAVIAFAIVGSLSPLQTDADYYGGSFDRGGRGRRDDDDRDYARGWRDAEKRPEPADEAYKDRPAELADDDRVRE